MQPAEAVGKITDDPGVLYILDACQSVGQLPVDVRKIGCDFLSMTGRKYFARAARHRLPLRQARHDGAHIEPIFLDNHAAKWTDDNAYTTRSDARRFENWERYFAGVIGLKVAADQASELGVEAIWARLRELADGLRARLSTLKGLTLTDLGKVKGAIVTFAVCRRRPCCLAQCVAHPGDQRQRLDPVLLTPRSQGPRPGERHARLGACLQHRGRARPLRGGARRRLFGRLNAPAGRFPELAFGAPEAAHANHRHLQGARKRRKSAAGCASTRFLPAPIWP